MAAKTERRHKQGDESRLAILDATLAIAAERGYDGTTVALVTEATGLPASSIYWHFGNKDKLLAATLEHSYRQWRKTAPTWDKRVEPEALRERIESRFQRAARALTQSPEFWSLGLMLTLQQRVKEPAARRLYTEVRHETEIAIRDWWHEVISDEADAADPELCTRLARFHMMLMDGLFIHTRSTSGRDSKRLVTLMAAGWPQRSLARRWSGEPAGQVPGPHHGGGCPARQGAGRGRCDDRCRVPTVGAARELGVLALH